MIALETYDENGMQHIISDAEGLRWGSAYGESGGGFTYFRFQLPREIGHNYLDLGYGYPFIARKYLSNVLFHGQIRGIEETSSPDSDKISVTVIGEITVSEDDEVLRVFCDTRLNMWEPPGEIPSGFYRPDYFSTGSNPLGLFLHANNGQDVEVGQYTELEYQFSIGEKAERFKCDLSMILGGGILFEGDFTYCFLAYLLSKPDFSADVSSIDVGLREVYYSNDTNEAYVRAGDALVNTTRSQTATVETIDTGTNVIVVTVGGDITTWQANDNLEIGGKVIYGVDTFGTESQISVGDVVKHGMSSNTLDVKSIDTSVNLITLDGDTSSGWPVDEGDYNLIIQFFGGNTIRYDPAFGAGEDFVKQGMSLFNAYQESGAVPIISDADTTYNLIELESGDYLTGWQLGDRLYVVGPAFSAQISGISGAVITYDGNTEVGEDNIVTTIPLANLTKKSIATIQSNDIGSDTITVTVASHISGWEVGDTIIQGESLFYGQIDGAPSGVTVTYKNDRGEQLVSDTTGWVVYNETEDNYATLASWDVNDVQFDVTDAGDMTGWSNDDVIRIYAPIKLAIYDTDDVRIWPTSDEREGALPHTLTSINVVRDPGSTSEPGKFTIRLTSFVAGSFGETVFAQLSNIKVYSTQDAVTTEMLAEHIVDLLSASGHDWDSSYDDIESITKVLEPMFFEFEAPRKAMEWACNFGDGSGNRIAWGIKLDDRRRFYLETQDLDTVSYVVRRTGPVQVSASGDIQQSWQQLRGAYQDVLGEQQLTDWQSDSDAYFNSKWRRRTLRLDSVDDDTVAVDLVAQALSEMKYQKTQGRYTVHEGSVFTPGGVPVPIDELKATGKLVMIEDWRSVEAGRSATDLRNTWTTFQLVGVEIDYDAGRAQLIPASPKSDFTTMVAEISRLATR